MQSNHLKMNSNPIISDDYTFNFAILESNNYDSQPFDSFEEMEKFY